MILLRQLSNCVRKSYKFAPRRWTTNQSYDEFTGRNLPKHKKEGNDDFAFPKVSNGWDAISAFIDGKMTQEKQSATFRGSKNFLKKLKGPFEDGLTRYDINLLEDVSWVKHILESMKKISTGSHKFEVNKNKHRNLRLGSHMCFESKISYEYDFSKYPDPETGVVMYTRVKNLDLNESEKHKLRVISGSLYDPDSDTIKISSNYNFKINKKAQDTFDQASNKIILANSLSDLISDAKNSPEEFAEIPVGVGDLSAKPSFPTKSKPKRRIPRKKRLSMLNSRTKQKFQYAVEKRKYNFTI